MVRSISILGSTGSIGRQTVAVAEHLGLQVRAITTNRSVTLAEEQARILSTSVPPAESPKTHRIFGSPTEDRLFLLSSTELDAYLPTDAERECKPTAYALANGAQAKEANGNCWWWLRNPGYYTSDTAGVNYNGLIHASGDNITSPSDAVRPAMWIKAD